jgi:hypothetical protein
MNDLLRWGEGCAARGHTVAILSNSGHFRLSENKPDRRSAAKLLTKDEARQIAAKRGEVAGVAPQDKIKHPHKPTLSDGYHFAAPRSSIDLCMLRKFRR